MLMKEDPSFFYVCKYILRNFLHLYLKGKKKQNNNLPSVDRSSMRIHLLQWWLSIGPAKWIITISAENETKVKILFIKFKFWKKLCLNISKQLDISWRLSVVTNCSYKNLSRALDFLYDSFYLCPYICNLFYIYHCFLYFIRETRMLGICCITTTTTTTTANKWTSSIHFFNKETEVQKPFLLNNKNYKENLCCYVQENFLIDTFLTFQQPFNWIFN